MGLTRFVPRSALAKVAATVVATITVGLSGGVAHADPGGADVDHQLAAAWELLEVVIEQYNGIGVELDETNAELVRAGADLERLGTQVAGAQERTGELSAALYRGAHISSVASLLTAASPGVFFDQLTALEHVARVQHRELAALTATRDAYAQRRRTLDALIRLRSTQQSDLAVRRTAIRADIRRLERLRGRAYRGTSRAARAALDDGYVPVFSPDAAGAALRFAYDQMGKPYRYAADGPESFDCSGLTMAAWQSAGVTLPHNAAKQFKAVARIERADLKPGDLVFYYRDIHHVAMYVGAGKVIEAPQHGEVVSVRTVDLAPIAGYGRPG